MNQDQSEKTLYHRGFPVELVSYSTRKFPLNDKSSFLESVTFRKENRSRQRETLILFRLKGMLYSPSALMHLDMEDIKITDSFDMLVISIIEVGVEVLTGPHRYTTSEFFHNGQKVKTCYSLNQDLYGNQSQTSKIKDKEDTIAENIKRHQQEMNKIQPDINLNMGAANGKIDGKNANAKCFTESRWTDRKQMGNIKLLGRHHGKHDREIGKETSERDHSKRTMLLTPNLSPDKFAKAGNSEVWKFINERTKMPNTCKRKQLCTNISDQEISWDEIVQNIIVPDIDRTEDRQQNGCFGGSLDEIKTGLVNPQQYTAVFHTKKTERKKLCKLCQDRELDTIFLPCGHLVCCHFCCRSQNFKLCPQCFKKIEHVNEAHF
ncbi:uncharacterized protein LOC127724422 isoform X3 [Mytilus californianus]|uniref:uncharacterized protein LOC127724422 isoform X3 n=1 Tax=Mytilus californianus TaxID=6549 RepID=UPI00224850F6|nr:uncharacterized protein LOC127724422 isoform X3 [Mytilus californianus]